MNQIVEMHQQIRTTIHAARVALEEGNEFLAAELCVQADNEISLLAMAFRTRRFPVGDVIRDVLQKLRKVQDAVLAGVSRSRDSYASPRSGFAPQERP